MLAERRIGQELIEAQKRGELATQERKPSTLPSGEGAPVTHQDIGITHKQAHEFRQMAELDEPDVEEVLEVARERGKPVAKADFNRKAAEREAGG